MMGDESIMNKEAEERLHNMTCWVASGQHLTNDGDRWLIQQVNLLMIALREIEKHNHLCPECLFATATTEGECFHCALRKSALETRQAVVAGNGIAPPQRLSGIGTGSVTRSHT